MRHRRNLLAVGVLLLGMAIYAQAMGTVKATPTTPDVRELH